MIRQLLLALTGSFALTASVMHGLTPSEKKIVDEARSRYYNLQASGFESLACDVSYDLNSAPFSDLPPSLKESLSLARVTLKINDRGIPTVNKQLPTSIQKDTVDQATQMLNVVSSLVEGVFQTWPTKGFFGPIPPFDNQINAIKITPEGYVFDLNVPGAPVLITTDRNFVTTLITSVGGRVLEKTTYSPSDKGLVFTGNGALSKRDAEPPIEVDYHLDTQVLDGMIVPAAVHVTVKPNIDARYTLTSCKVLRTAVVQVK